MNKYETLVRNANPEEFCEIGKLIAKVYSELEGFPNEIEQPEYYNMLYNIGEFVKKPGAEILVAVDGDEKIAGAVVYFSDMQYYGSGGTATNEKYCAGFRLLAVDSALRGKGYGKLLSNECIKMARTSGHKQVIIHSTKAMNTAWQMYQKLGFKRSEDLDFMQGNMAVYGFRLMLQSDDLN